MNPADEHDQIVTVSDCLLAHLEGEGVDAVFGIPGGNIAPFQHSLRAHPRIRFLVASHEGGAAFMADGYARATGKLGVCLVIAGPGILNAVTGVASAHLDQTPLLVVSGQVRTDHFGLAAMQESTDAGGVNTVELMRHATASSMAIVDPASFPRLLGRALRTALAPPGAAVHLCIPPNVARQRISSPSARAQLGAFRSAVSEANAKDVRALFELLDQARRPLIFLGAGARAALEADHEGFRTLVHTLGVPVTTSLRGKGLFAEDDPMSLGVFGLGGDERAVGYLREGVDALVVLGSRLGEWASRSFSEELAAVRMVAQVDLRAPTIGQLMPVRLPIVADVGSVLAGLQAHVGRPGQVDVQRARGRLRATCAAAERSRAPLDRDGPLKPQQVFAELDAALRGDMDLYIDIGNCTGWAAHCLRVVPPTRIFFPTGLTAMGWSCGAVVGGKIGRPDRVAVAITGDGAFVMNGTEIRTASRYGLGTVTVVLNDDRLGMVNHGEAHSTPEYGLDDDFYGLGSPDLEAFAGSLGARAHRVDQPGELTAAFAEAVRRAAADRQPQVIVAHIDHREPPPYGDRFRAVHRDRGS